MMLPALLTAALLLLLPATLAEYSEKTPIEVAVRNNLQNKETLSYSTYVVYRGILIGAMRRLMDSGQNFKFTYSEDPDYGPFLESVNGLARNVKDRTYWELLVKKTDGEIIRPDVGFGCYIPSANEQIIFNFTTW